jgi:pimeloyl-ACP methyl ester carboxylesterase
MPFLEIRGAKLHYTDDGSGPETIVFSHGLLFSGKMFAAQVEALKSDYRCITFDHRGQGQSAVTPSGYDMEDLAKDARALINQLDIGSCHFVGLSMGGFVGMRLAARHPGLIRSLTIIDSSADPEPEENHGRYRLLNFVARWFGLGVVAGRVMPILFGQSFLDDPAKAEDRKYWRAQITGADRMGITRAVAGVIERQGVIDEIGSIACPTLVLVGDEDVATVPEKSKRIQAAIPGAELVIIPKAGHSATIEQPDKVTAEMRRFLDQAANG